MELVLWIVGIVLWILIGIVVTKIFCNIFDLAGLTTDKIIIDTCFGAILGIICWPILAIILLLWLLAYGLINGIVWITRWIMR